MKKDVAEIGWDEVARLVMSVTNGLTWEPNIIGTEMAVENDQIKVILVLRYLVRPRVFNGVIIWVLRSMAIPARRIKTAAQVACEKKSIALH